MMYQDWWNIMRHGDVDTALAQMKVSFDNAWKRESVLPLCVSEALELGAGYLWLMDFESARQHFDTFNERFPRHTHRVYDMAGVASWCLGNFDGAIAQWRLGLNTEFADAGGGTTPRLLLYFASVLRLDESLKAEAVSELRRRDDDPRWDNWPRPLGEFVLGRIDLNTLRQRGIDVQDEDTTLLCQWEVDFWLGVVERWGGDESEYHSAMKKCARLSWADFDECRDLFLCKLWSPEFYLARHQADKTV